ncbi:MAG: peptidylprolyl isomerase [Armatimonadetes bacterium]|nr:peptidylprolyl isomerase [Armatimonadota bacterium]
MERARFFVWILVCWVALALQGCAGGDSGMPPSDIAVSPSTTGVVLGRTIQFTALPTGGTFVPVTWEVVGGDKNGTVSTSGLYTAPKVTGTYQVRVYVTKDPSIAAVANVTVATGVSISIEPETILGRYSFGQQVPFKASILGTDASKITWSVSDPDGGVVSNAGVYVAPSKAGYYRVTATSQEDPTKTGNYDVLVSDTKVVKMTVQGKGDIYIRMAQNEAPNTTDNFLSLTRSGFYNGSYFHRYGPDEGQPTFIQGGDPLTKTLPLDDPSIGTGGPGYTINFETNSLKHELGAIAMARGSGLNTAGSQFYICQETIPAFDGNYVVFGKVIGNISAALTLRRFDKISTAVVVE